MTPHPPSARTQRVATRHLKIRDVLTLAALLTGAAAAFSLLILLPTTLQTRELRARRDALAQEVETLQRSIETLDREAQALHDDPWAVERALRRRLGYLRPDERVF